MPDTSSTTDIAAASENRPSAKRRPAPRNIHVPASSAAADRAAQTLSRPFTLRGLTVPNRIVMAPMT